MNKKLIFRSLAIAGLLANIILPFTFSSVHTDYSSIAIEPFHCKTENTEYTIGLPKDWTTTVTDTQAVNTFLTCKGPAHVVIKGKSTLANGLTMDITKALSNNPLSHQSPVKPAHDHTVLEMAITSRNFQETESQNFDLGGREAFITKFKLTSNHGFVAMRMAGAIVTTANGEAPVSFTLLCPEKEFDQAFPLFQRCLESFKPIVEAPKASDIPEAKPQDAGTDPNAPVVQDAPNAQDMPSMPVPEQ